MVKIFIIMVLAVLVSCGGGGSSEATSQITEDQAQSMVSELTGKRIQNIEQLTSLTE